MPSLPTLSQDLHLPHHYFLPRGRLQSVLLSLSFVLEKKTKVLGFHCLFHDGGRGLLSKTSSAITFLQRVHARSFWLQRKEGYISELSVSKSVLLPQAFVLMYLFQRVVDPP